MPNAQAVRKDHNPFAWITLLQFIRWTDHCCPHCQEVYRRTYFPGPVFLSDSRRICSECGIAFDDESREWPELRGGQKLRLLLPPGVLGLSGGILLCGVIALFMVSRDENWVSGVLLLGVSLGASIIPALAWTAMRLPGILRSTGRYRAVISPTQSG